MNTDELVSFLATGESAADKRSGARRLASAVVLGTTAACLLTGGLLGFQPALGHEALLPMFWVRETFCAALAGLGLVLLARVSRPGSRLGLVPAALAVPVLAIWFLAAWMLLTAAPQDRTALVLGQTASACPFLIALVSTPLLLAFVWTMRGLAPTHLRLAGAASGLAAGAGGALVYTLHCPELAAPFLGIWYLLGMLIPTAVGAWFGPRLLRW